MAAPMAGDHAALPNLSYFLSLKDIHSDTEAISNLAIQLKNLTSWLKSSENRANFTEDAACSLRHLLSISKTSLLLWDADQPLEDHRAVEVLHIIIEACRSLRNACAMCPRNQNLIREADLVPVTVDVLEFLIRHQKENRPPLIFSEQAESGALVSLCLRCGMQFLGNMVTQNEENQTAIWRAMKKLFTLFMRAEDEALPNYTCMVLHNCSAAECREELVETPEGALITAEVLKLLARQDTDFGLILINSLLAQSGFLVKTYVDLDESERLALLDMIEIRLSDFDEKTASDSEDKVIAIENLQCLCREYQQRAKEILGIIRNATSENQEPLSLVKLLSILCYATACHATYGELLNDPGLIECSINLLHCIHLIGLEGGNIFSVVDKASGAQDVDQTHPGFGLKKDLIRLVGNLCYRHRVNQDKVREMGGVSLIMNHTGIDARNPFIMQWSVFAIRNLCEGNAENQQIIAGMKLENVTDKADLLRKYGIKAEVKDGKVVVKVPEDDDDDNGRSAPFRR